MTDVSKKIALVTGASRGIGKSIATTLGKQGMTVIGTATTQKGAADIAHYLQDAKIEGTGMCFRIINVSSVVASSGNAGQTNYAASKAAIEGFSRSLAREIGSRGITVNCVAPGFIDTDMTRALSEKQMETFLTQIPLGRFGQVEEISAAVGFLASDSGAYITGETLHINGGMYMP